MQDECGCLELLCVLRTAFVQLLTVFVLCCQRCYSCILRCYLTPYLGHLLAVSVKPVITQTGTFRRAIKLLQNILGKMEENAFMQPKVYICVYKEVQTVSFSFIFDLFTHTFNLALHCMLSISMNTIFQTPHTLKKKSCFCIYFIL